MLTINVKKFGFATGLTGTLLYAGCILVMATVGQNGTAKFFNSILHGIDTASIVRMNVPFWKACMGLVETFIVAWLIGASIAAIYNAANRLSNIQ